MPLAIVPFEIADRIGQKVELLEWRLRLFVGIVEYANPHFGLAYHWMRGNQTKLCTEAVAHSPDGMNELGVLGVVFQLLPQPGDVNVDGARGNIALIFPDMLQQILSRNHGPAPVDEITK